MVFIRYEDYASFKNQISDYPEFEFEEKTLKPVVFIKTIVDRIEIKFSKFIDEFKKYLDFDCRKYNASEKKISMTKEHLKAVNKINKRISI